MRLDEIFGGSPQLAELLAEANALDDPVRFAGATAAAPLEARHAALERAVRECAGSFAARAGLPDASAPAWAAAPVYAGQQPYVDYYPAVLAKLDALDAPRASFYTFADYPALGTDPWLARTELPSVSAADGLLRLHLHAANGPHRGKDLRFVPPPAPAVIDGVADKLKAMIRLTARELTRSEGFSTQDAFARLRALLAHQREAQARARNAAEFNAIWSARTFRELGFATPLLSLSELLDHEAVLPSVAAALAPFVEHHALVAESVAEVLRADVNRTIPFAPKELGHVPLALADARGMRRPLRAERRGADWWLVAARGEEAFNVGRADADALAAFLRGMRGRWSPDVFVPAVLFRLGVAGIVSGRGSIRYSLVVAHVMRRLLGQAHPPNLLCSCAPGPSGPFAEALLRAHGGELPAAVRASEPVLIGRLLHSAPAVIREEIAASWRDEPRG